MKKKLIAALAAAITALCSMTVPSAAEESRYEAGDVNRDGKITLADAQMALREYVTTTLGQHPPGTYLDAEQRALAMVGDRSTMSEQAADHVMMDDCSMLLGYYVYYMGHRTEQPVGVLEFYRQNPPAPVREIIGDLDLDGQITIADYAWAELISYASGNVWGDFEALVPLSDEQLRQCDLIPDDENYSGKPLSSAEARAFYDVMRLKYVYMYPSEVTVKDYLADKGFYSDYMKEHRYSKVSDYQYWDIDWAALGLPDPPTEDEFLFASNPGYAIEHSENKDNMTDEEMDAIYERCAVFTRKFKEIIDKSHYEKPPELTSFNNLMKEVHQYHKISTQPVTIIDQSDPEHPLMRTTTFYKINITESGEREFIILDERGRREQQDFEPGMTWDALTAELEAAKEWRVFPYLY